MEENINTAETQQTPGQQPNTEKKVVLMPGQEHEDELDFMGAALFGLIGKGFNWIKNLFQPQK